jgi:hypothetical protein
VLFINAPIAAGVLADTGVLVPGENERGRLDGPGAVTATLGIGAVIYALTRGNTNGWADRAPWSRSRPGPCWCSRSC